MPVATAVQPKGIFNLSVNTSPPSIKPHLFIRLDEAIANEKLYLNSIDQQESCCAMSPIRGMQTQISASPDPTYGRPDSPLSPRSFGHDIVDTGWPDPLSAFASGLTACDIGARSVERWNRAEFPPCQTAEAACNAGVPPSWGCAYPSPSFQRHAPTSSGRRRATRPQQLAAVEGPPEMASEAPLWRCYPFFLGEAAADNDERGAAVVW